MLSRPQWMDATKQASALAIVSMTAAPGHALRQPWGIDLGRLLVTLATFLVLLLAAASVAPAFMDWKAYRPDIERAASALLGRKISIIGDIDVALLPEP